MSIEITREAAIKALNDLFDRAFGNDKGSCEMYIDWCESQHLVTYNDDQPEPWPTNWPGQLEFLLAVGITPEELVEHCHYNPKMFEGEDSMIDITGLDKAQVLIALYNCAQPQGLGRVLQGPAPLSTEQAQSLLDGGHTYIDYLKGRVMKVEIGGDTLDPDLYDRDNGEGAALGALRKAGLIS